MSPWACIGQFPLIAPCGASGTEDRDAERHGKATGHGTSSGLTERGVAAVVKACGGAA